MIGSHGGDKKGRTLPKGRDDTRKPASGILDTSQIPFIIRHLTNSVAVLSLIVENATKHAKDETFLTRSFEAIADEVKKIEEVIQILKR